MPPAAFHFGLIARGFGGAMGRLGFSLLPVLYLQINFSCAGALLVFCSLSSMSSFGGNGLFCVGRQD